MTKRGKGKGLHMSKICQVKFKFIRSKDQIGEEQFDLWKMQT